MRDVAIAESAIKAGWMHLQNPKCSDQPFKACLAAIPRLAITIGQSETRSQVVLCQARCPYNP